MKITGNEPASPIVSSEGVISSIGFIDKDNDYDARGLTIPQYFSGMALKGILSNEGWVPADNAAEMALKYADAMIKKLNETPNPNE